MRRSFWSRAFSALWSLWLVAALTDAGGLHSCPAHGMHAAHAMAGMHHAAGAQQAPDSHGSKEHQKPCTCLGSCCVAPAIAAPRSGYEVIPAAFVRATAPDYSNTAAPRLERAHARPFPNGPPAQA